MGVTVRAPSAFFSKSPEARRRFIEARIAASGSPVTLHLHPKNLAREKYAPGVLLAAYEDITKTDVWLRINSLVGENAFLVLENPSRYPKITSEKVKFLRRLSMRLRGGRVITDIVPFTDSVEYLYTPYSYLGREILGYSHWYAFRENYQEIDGAGRVVHALDYPVLARKAAPVSAIDYCRFTAARREVVSLSETAEEQSRYDAKRDALFERYEAETAQSEEEEENGSPLPPQKMVTRLADLVHAFPSRLDALTELAAGFAHDFGGMVVSVHNLLSYAKTAQARYKAAGIEKRCAATSYQLGAERVDWTNVSAVIYAESPIVHSYYLLDIEAALPAGCRVAHLRGQTKVDRYLYGRIANEMEQIDAFADALYAATEDNRYAV